MPDWSYRTTLRPLLFRLPPAVARDASLRAMGTLARLPLGPQVIDFLGHMGPPPALRRTLMGLIFPSPVGLGAGIDVAGMALPALARFGFGFLEVGPVTPRPEASAAAVERFPKSETLGFPEPPHNPGVEALARRLEKGPRPTIPLFARLAVNSATAPEAAACELGKMVARLSPFVDAFTLPMPPAAPASEAFRIVVAEAQKATPPRPVLAILAADLDDSEIERVVRAARQVGVGGVIVDGVQGPASGRLLGPPSREPTLRTVRHLRKLAGPDFAIIASGGIHCPDDALRLREAGADLVQVDSGLVFAGPGLPKRMNEALLFAETKAQPPGKIAEAPAPELTWFWTLLMGLGMLLGGILALVVASTRVVLPYDESYLGLSRREIHSLNDHLLLFMAHDRVTLAGTMVAIGVMYSGLSLFGIRRGMHWARATVLSSACVGFASFFLFLGFGYFDTFHAFVTAVLLQFLLLGVHSRLGPAVTPAMPNLRDDWRWRLSLWAQLLWIVQACAFLVAGVVIAAVGVTTVFVHEDLEFLGTTAEALSAAHPRIVPLVAHDRASFGGMLVVSGMAFLMPSLWGFRRGERWLWWTFLLAGTPAYAAAIAVHVVVGYHNLWHLTPAFLGLGLFAAGLGLSYPYLCGRDPALEALWREHFGRGPGRGAGG